MTFNSAIKQLRSEGFTDDEILEDIIKIRPDLSASVEQLKTEEIGPDEIVTSLSEINLPDRKASTGESILSGAIEGVSDLPALAEGVSSFLPGRGQTPGEKARTQIETEADPTSAAFALLADSDDDIMGSLYRPLTKKEYEEGPPESTQPFSTLQERLPKSKKGVDSVLRRGARFGAGALSTGASPSTALRVGASGLAGQTVRELGGPEALAIATELGLPEIAFHSIRNRFQGGNIPTPVARDIERTAKELGIKKLPASSITESRVIQQADTILSQSAFGKNAYESTMNEIKGSLSENLDNVLNTMSKKGLNTLEEGGQSLQDQFKRAHRQVRSYNRGLYGFSEKAAENIMVPIEEIERTLSGVNKKMKRSFKPNTDEAAVSDFTSQMLKEIRDSAKNGKVPLSRLVGQKASINGMINYQKVGGAKEYIKGINNSLKRNIEKYGSKNPTFWSRYQAAEKNAANEGKYFRNMLMRSVLYNESPEAILNAINKPSDLTKLKNALNTNGINQQTRGQINEVIESIKRRKFEDIIMDRLRGPDGQFKMGSTPAIPKRQREFAQALLPKESRKIMKNIDKIRKRVSTRSSELANNSRTFQNAVDLGASASAVAAIGHLLVGDTAGFARFALPAASLYIGSRLMNNVKFVSILQNLERLRSQMGNRKPSDRQLTRWNELVEEAASIYNEERKKAGLTRSRRKPLEEKE